MLKRILKTVSYLAFFIFFLNCLPQINAQEDKVVHAEPYLVSAPVKNSMWYICRKSGKKAGSIQKGPFESRINAIANWYYYNINSKKSCLAENMTFVTSEPENDFLEDYEAVKKDLEENHSEALKKYSIKPLAKLEKKYIKKTPALTNDLKTYEIDFYSIQKKCLFENKLTSDYTVSFELEMPKKITFHTGDKIILKWMAKSSLDLPSISINFLDVTEIMEENIAEGSFFEGYKVFEVPENLPEKYIVTLFYDADVGEGAKLVFAKRSDRIDLHSDKTEEALEEDSVEDVNEEVPSEETEEEEAEFNFVPNSAAYDASIQRYKKEYLQDYALVDEFVIPPVEPVEKKLIANPNLKDNKGRTDLMKAAASGNEWQVKNLLESGAKVDLQDNDGWTALMYAARYSDSLATMTLLLDAAADVKIKNKYDSTALLLAVCYGNNPQIVSKLMEYYSNSDKELLKAFVFLLSSNYTYDYVMKAKINLFLEKEIPLNTFYNGKTPLMYAAQYASSTEIIQILLEHDALKTLRSVEGKTVFDYAKENSKLARDDIYWSLNSQR